MPSFSAAGPDSPCIFIWLILCWACLTVRGSHFIVIDKSPEAFHYLKNLCQGCTDSNLALDPREISEKSTPWLNLKRHRKKNCCALVEHTENVKNNILAMFWMKLSCDNKHRSPAVFACVKFPLMSVDWRLLGRTRLRQKGISITQGRKSYSEFIFPLHSGFTKLCDHSPAW